MTEEICFDEWDEENDVPIYLDLVYAVIFGDLDEVLGLLEKGADAYELDKALAEAVDHEAGSDMIGALLRAGADVNTLDWGGKTVLLRAAMQGQAEIVEMLLDAGADDCGGTAANLFSKKHSLRKSPVLQRLREVWAGGAKNTADAKMSADEFIDVGRRDALLWSDLTYAVLREDLGEVLDLLEKGANANDLGEALLEAISWRASREVIGALLRAGADVNARDAGGKTALMRATRRGHAEMVDMLLDAGADASAVDSRGRTADDFSKEHGMWWSPTKQWFREVCAEIAKNPAYANRLAEGRMIVDGDRTDGKMSADEWIDLCRTGTSRQIIATVKAGVDIPKNGRLILPFLCAYTERSDIPDADAINALIEAGAEVNAHYARENTTALMFTARHGAAEALDALIGKGAEVDARTEDESWTAWMYAAAHDRLEAKAILLRAGADVNEEDVYPVWGYGCAPRAPWALVAILQNREAAKRIAVDYVRNPALKNSDVFPRVWEACLSGFERGGSGISDLDFICLCALGTRRDVQAAIKRGADVNAQSRDNLDRWTSDPYRMTPLMVAAAYNGDPGVIRALLKAGADPKARCVRERVQMKVKAKEFVNPGLGFTDEDELVMVNVLLRENGLTALMLALKCLAPEEVVTALIEGGVCVNAQDDRGRTALHYAVQKYVEWKRFEGADTGTITALLDGGADAALKDNDGRRAVDLLGDCDAPDDGVLQRLRNASGTE